MDEIPKLLTAMAAILWPVIVLIVLIRIAPTLSAVVESARQRGFSVEFAGQKLTMQEITSQQGDTIGDLLGQVATLRKDMEAMSATIRTFHAPTGTMTSAPAPQAAVSLPQEPRRILWVDDRPKNNSYLVSQLQQLGITVDQVTSTEQAMTAVTAAPYDVIISDMGRQEDSGYKVSAGVDLTRLLRGEQVETPLIIYCAVAPAERHGPEAIQAGATAVTSSPTDLLGMMGINRRKASI